MAGGRIRSPPLSAWAGPTLAFARAEPAYYSAMFEAAVPLDTNPELRQAGDRAFATLRTAAEALIAIAPECQPASSSDGGAPCLGPFAWHRVAVWSRGCGTAHAADDRPKSYLEAGTLVYLRGLGLTGTGARRHLSLLDTRKRPAYVNVINIHT